MKIIVKSANNGVERLYGKEVPKKKKKFYRTMLIPFQNSDNVLPDGPVAHNKLESTESAVTALGVRTVLLLIKIVRTVMLQIVPQNK